MRQALRAVVLAAAALVVVGVGRADEEMRLSGRADLDLFRGRPAEAEAELTFLFRVGQDQYKTLTTTQPLEGGPTVAAPAGLKVEVVSHAVETARVGGVHIRTEHRGREIVTTTGTGDGYRLVCRVRLSADDRLPYGRHTVTLTWPQATETARRIGADALATPTWTVEVEYWESPAARAEHERAERQRKAEEAARATARLWMKVGLVVGGVVGLVVLVRLGRRVGRWLTPRHRVGVRPGEAERLRATFTREVTLRGEQFDEGPGPLTQTTEARTFWGGRSGVTVRSFALPVGVEGFPRVGSVGVGGPSCTVRITYEATLTVEARPGARRGTLLAETPAGRLEVRVAG
jgi:hypothetical protein